MNEDEVRPITVLRPEDLLLLRFYFHGLKLKAPESDGQPWLLVKNPPGEPKPLIIIEFPPQSISEQSFFELVKGVAAPNGQPPPDPPDPIESETPTKPGEVKARLSGPTRLVINVADQVPIPYTLTGLLMACANGNQVVSVERKMPPELDWRLSLAELHAQGGLFSSIEVPYHLALSPEIGTTWWGRGLPKPNAAGTRFEMWHVSMLQEHPTPDNKHPKPGGKLRAVWATDFATWPNDNTPPAHLIDENHIRTSLDARDRYELVRLTTDTNKPYTKPIEADQLILSPMGAWFKAKGSWKWDIKNHPPGISVVEWNHLMTMGRDHFVRVVYRGYLFPFGHEASLVKITERKIQDVPDDSSGQRAAYLRTRMFVIVRQPTLDYNYNGFPFQKVTLKTLVTPGIDPPEQSQIDGHTQDAFWIRADDAHVQFHVVATDHDNRKIEFTTPLAFISSDKAIDSSAVSGIVTNAWMVLNAPSGSCNLGGQLVAFMPHDKPNDTTLETKTITLVAEAKKINNGTALRFRPTVAQAEVDIPAVKQLLGTNTPSTIVYDDDFKEAAAGHFDNPANVFARITSPAPQARFKTEQAGGLVKPDFAIQGLSRSLGTVPQVEAMKVGKFNPTDVFPKVKLLGGIQLNEIVNLVEFEGTPEKGELLPQLVTKVESGVAITRYRWHLTKTIADDPAKPKESRGELIDSGLFKPDIGAELEIVSEVCQPLNGSAGSFLSTGRLTQFHIVLLPATQLIDLYFESITFTARSGQKTDVSVNLKSITFLGPLTFVNALMQVVPLDGFSDPPNLNIDANGVGLGYTLAIPSVGIGVFSLQNLSLSAGFYLPFGESKSNIQLAFCTRENPGQVLVSLFGGGVFFGIILDTEGVQMVEMAMEFGAGISLNLGVASGSVTVMGGVYYQKSGDEALLSAYIRMIGKLSVLGLISVTVEFYLALDYLATEDKLFGVAALRVKVKVVFFSKTVTLEVRREFKGSDPTFRQVMALPDWQDYCEVFGD